MRGIIFQSPMVRALLAGRKTQTRRPVRIDDAPISKEDCEALSYQRGIPSNAVNVRMLGFLKCDAPPGSATVSSRVSCPYGDIGDRLYVKERIDFVPPYYPRAIPGGDPRDSEATMTPGYARYAADETECEWLEEWRWKTHKLSPLFMPFEARRLEIELTMIGAEQLRSISREDAIAEGAFFTDYGTIYVSQQRPGWSMVENMSWKECLESPQSAVGNYFNRIHGGENWNLKRGPSPWDRNPWVWVLTFNVHRRAA